VSGIKIILLALLPVYKHSHSEDDDKDEEKNNGNHLVHSNCL